MKHFGLAFCAFLSLVHCASPAASPDVIDSATAPTDSFVSSEVAAIDATPTQETSTTIDASTDNATSTDAPSTDTVTPPEDAAVRPLALTRFRFGSNGATPPAGWGDPQIATLASRAGANSLRVKLPEYHLDRWGYDIEVADMQAYAMLGLRDHVAFIGGPTRAHSSAPATIADWQLDQYAPRNLYQPIWRADGSINPDNYYAAYVYRTVERYRTWVRIWEVWNEPDQVGGNWQVTQQWSSRAPAASELPWWNDTIYAYIRMLRITWEVVHRLDPDGLVATGGIGYPTFLSALTRYTDNPANGVTGPDFPRQGSAYIDVLSYHYYPVFRRGTSDEGADGLIETRNEFQTILTSAGASVRGWVVTESGAPHVMVSSANSGSLYARNYLLKAYTLAQANRLLGVDWFSLWDDRPATPNTNDAFHYMGLYEPVAAMSAVDAARRTESGIAYATLGRLLNGATYDADATSALVLSGNLRGAVFRLPSGARAWVLWARTSGGAETANASFNLRSDRAVLEHAWDFSSTMRTETRMPSNGIVALTLDGTPRIFVSQ